ncbi:MAG: radical SAM protein, partial [Spirochaetales bacterium]|nr:radical SAM protein [Spirochaetales bacterium]
YKCNFCYHSSKYRLRSIESIISEIKYYRQQINFDTIFFADDLWFLNKERIDSFIRSISELDFSFHYRICARIDILSKLDDNSLKQLSESGCKTMFLGIESGSDKILNTMHKNINKQQIIEQIKRLTHYNITPCGSIMIGQLHETLDDINETLNLVQKLIQINPLTEITFNYVTPYPGSELYDMLLTKGYIKNHLDFFTRFFSKTKNWDPFHKGEKYSELQQKYNTLKQDRGKKKKIRSSALTLYKFINFQVRFPMRNLYDRIFINKKEMYNFENLNVYFEVLMHWQPVVNISDMNNQDLFYAFQVIEKGYFNYKRKELGRTIYILEFIQYLIGYIKKKFTARLSSLLVKKIDYYYDSIQTLLDDHIWKLRNKVKAKKTITLKIVNEENVEQRILKIEDTIKFQDAIYEYIEPSKNLVFRGFYPQEEVPLKRGGE